MKKNKEEWQQQLILSLKKKMDASIIQALSFGADPHLNMPNGEKIINYVFRLSSEYIVNHFIMEGLHNKYGKSFQQKFLFISSSRGFLYVVEHLIKEQDFHQVELDHAYLLAVESGDLLTVDFLIRSGANINAVDGINQNAILKACRHQDTDMVLYLEKCGCDLYHKDKDGDSALHLSCHNCIDVKLIHYLLSRNLDVNAHNNYGFTPLLDAICSIELNFESDFLTAARLLLKNGADPHVICDDGNHSLLFACMFFGSTDAIDPHIELVKLLLNEKVDPLHRNNAGADCFEMEIGFYSKYAECLLKEAISTSPIQVPNYEINNSYTNSSEVKGFNEDSFLSRNGYSTKLKHEERWSILKEKILTQIPAQKVVNFMSYRIRLCNQPKSRAIKYADAIYTYKYDIERIRNYCERNPGKCED
ncbi:ankyrin repeat domain-containing protein [Guptibacillus sedimenti]|uniref:ankyrin repeat domain-containing protein n=1 Tax=Guptibacillus sedimenti TaxID=3025680 RepID=UPI0023600D3A|nr:ankyrin repeat domain-containing protein [Pseudalkalibacillus sedimenti]